MIVGKSLSSRTRTSSSSLYDLTVRNKNNKRSGFFIYNIKFINDL